MAKWQKLKLGIEGRDTAEVLDGLAAGEIIIKPSQPSVKLADGTKVLVP